MRVTPLIAIKSLRPDQGFTLVEAMVVLAIMAIALAITIPSMVGFTQDSRISSNANEFIGAITLARTEAVKRGRLVTICRSSDADSSTPSCDAATSDWAAGWLVYEEDSASTNVGTHESTEPVILRHSALPAGTEVPSSPVGTASITFNNLGEPIGQNTGTLGFNFSVKKARARQVCVTRNGRIKVIPNATTCA